MGSGPGSLKDYIDTFRSDKLLQGGFIWQWASHGLLTRNEHGAEYYGYGGDFGDKLNDPDFILDGSCWSDHKPGPWLAEYKKVIEPVTIEKFARETGKVTLRRLYFFSDLSHLSCSWNATAEDKEATEPVNVPFPHIAPGSVSIFHIPLEDLAILEDNSSRDAWLNLSFKPIKMNEWTPAGGGFSWTSADGLIVNQGPQLSITRA
ncbi:hypothetical protein FSARC_13324 [Fusarium sarcochroum]|uniref:beta-galactosidase n=1 Tax=Fusarium sarcochroum TaxID=1208366 RepID=A0A8H4T2A7_9HYPO|nr:hypothetical protein FSARC_13324 [Fusarium sarcochroum]